MPDFKHLLNTKADDVKELPVLPKGTYLARVGQYSFQEFKTKDGPKPVMQVPFKLESAIGDVAGQLPPRLPEIKHNFWLTNPEGEQDEHTLAPVKQMIEACGIDTAGRGIGECMAETLNATLALEISHRPNEKNPERPFAQIANFAKA